MKRALLLFPNNYSLLDNFKKAFVSQNYEVKTIDFNTFFTNQEQKVNRYLLKLPQKYKWKTITKINRKVNDKYKEIFDEYKPDIVFTYNEQKLNKSTVDYFNRTAITAFFLGDYPLFIQNRPDNLAAILAGKHIFSPDSYWMEQMKLLGAKSVHFLIPGYTENLNYTKEITQEEQNKWGSDLVFIGRQYHDTWGYKRALFLNSFTKFDLKIYGDASWYKWFNYFPNLEENFTLNKSYLPFETLNTILNASKIYPIDANPGVINGLHVRIFDCIGSGILPLVEYRYDLERVFKDVEVPNIKNYNHSKELANHWLQDETKRRDKIKELKHYIEVEFSTKKIAQNLFDKLI